MNTKLGFGWRLAPLGLLLVSAVKLSAAPRTDLGVRDMHFTLNGRETFLYGISYYGALGASEQAIRQDLDDMRQHGFNWLRVWATWAAFTNDVSAVDAEGRARQPFLNKLAWLLEECDRRDLVVDVTLSRGNGVTGPLKLQTLAAHRRAVETLVTALRPHRNWYLDLSNERNIRDARYTSFSDLAELRELARSLDPNRLVTASHAGDLAPDDLRQYLMAVKVDFLSPHRPRNAASPAQTRARTLEYLAGMRDLGCRVPVHYQEPFRRDYGWQPRAEDFLADVQGARAGGAAGWCFHNGDHRSARDGQPRRSFDLRSARLFEQLDPEERRALTLLAQAVPGLSGQTAAKPARGPLRVHPANPRYFTDDGRRAVLLVGSHTWDNLQDMGEGDPPAVFDFEGYLDFLCKQGHNFIRLWRWEMLGWDTQANNQKPPKRLRAAPHPWARTGPGTALDGKPRFNLEKFDDEYFHRLRARVAAAGDRGIYVSVMLFEGWGLQHVTDAWKAHPFHPDNHVNRLEGVTRETGATQIHTLSLPAVTRIQEAYVRQVIDTVNDLDNVLYEIANESGAYSTEWQEHFIRFLRDCEKRKSKQHPVGMTFQYSRDPKQRGSNATLFKGPADWISPNPDAGEFNYRSNPPPGDGRKVVVSDTDHLWGIGGDSAWVWKSFLRGLNPIFMDPYKEGVLRGGSPAKWESVRQAMGAARRLAERINLAAMTPHGELASSTYCLANPLEEYVVYLPTGGEGTVDLSAVHGNLRVEWIHPDTGASFGGKPATGGARRSFVAPFKGHALLRLSQLSGAPAP